MTTTRRAILGAAVAAGAFTGAAAGTAIATAWSTPAVTPVAEPDPIFAAIREHAAAMAGLDAACHLQSELDFHDPRYAGAKRAEMDAFDRESDAAAPCPIAIFAHAATALEQLGPQEALS